MATNRTTDLELINAFNDCIDRVSAGQSITDCLRLYPGHAAQLRAMLETGSAIKRSNVAPAEVRQAQDRVRLRLQGYRRQQPSHFRLLRVSGLAALIAVLVFTGSGLAAEQSLPGDVLYPIKRLTEDLRLSVAGSSPELAQQFEQRRIDEIKALLAARRVEEVYFEGDVILKAENQWQVDSLTVQVAPDVPGAEIAQVGDRVGIHAATTLQGTLVAGEVVVVIPSSLPTSTPMPTATITSTSTVTLTPSATPSPTVTLTLTATSTNTPTITPTRSFVPTRIRSTLPPTQNPPTDDHGGVDDHGGGSNSGSGGSSGGSGGGGGSDG